MRSDGFFTSLQTYREKASQRFLNHKNSKQHVDAVEGSCAASQECYKRVIFPALQLHLEAAAIAYRAFKDRQLTRGPTSRLKKRLFGVLGDGEVVVALAAEVRRARWVVAKAIARHRREALVHALRDFVLSCGIPADVRKSAHDRFLRRGTSKQAKVSHTVMMNVGRAQENEKIDEICANANGFAQHVGRCREGIRIGLKALKLTSDNKAKVKLDSFEEVKKRYTGKPDEIYKRKTARKFARYRRKRREEEEKMHKTCNRAEAEMKRRRGHDHLLTTRKNGDSSFAPFLFQLESNAYAFSSKITEAPKLRKAMLSKYSTKDESYGKANGWDKAQEAAEANPLFHTRVMNRFT